MNAGFSNFRRIGACGLLLGAALGCTAKSTTPAPSRETPAAAPQTVRLLVVDDDPLAEAISRQWSARAEGKLEVRAITAEELTQTLAPSAPSLAADAIVYPSALLGELVQRELIAPLPESVAAHPQFDRGEIFDLIRLREMTWGMTTFAVPFGSPQLVLLYRQDLLARVHRAPPKTWAEYQELVERLADREKLGDLIPAEPAPWHAAVEPLGKGWGALVLLSRAGPYLRHPGNYSDLFDFTTMEPLIAGPPMERALAELVAAARSFPPDAAQFSPHDARQRFFQGQCGLALCWPTRAVAESSELSGKVLQQTASAELPGSPVVYDFLEQTWTDRSAEDSGRVPLLAAAGRLGSITASAGNPRGAANALLWLSGKDWSGDIAPASRATTLFRRSHLHQPAPWVEEGLSEHAALQYAELVAATQQRQAFLFALRLPGGARYLAALDEAVHAALSGTATPAEALTAAAAQWRRITEELGLDSQRRAYQRSLGLEP